MDSRNRKVLYVQRYQINTNCQIISGDYYSPTDPVISTNCFSTSSIASNSAP
jgi:hypothetical protein